MEEVDFTTGQFRILLGMTPDPLSYDAKTASLVSALHHARPDGHKWRTDLTKEDIETALELFITHQVGVRTPAAQKALSFFVGGSATARAICDERRASGDVPRETSTEDTP